MKEIIKTLLFMSAAGSVFALVVLCIKPLTKKLFSPRWQYYIWLAVFIVMVLPIRISLPAEPVHIAPPENAAMQTAQPVPSQTKQNRVLPNTPDKIAQRPALEAPDIPVNLARIFGFLWLAVAVLLGGYKLGKYIVFLHEIKKHSVTDCKIENIPKRLTVRKTELLDAPLIVGLTKPVLYLPQTKIKDEDLTYILLHELTHYRRRDLLFKWFAMLVSIIHWFNPFVYIVSKQMDDACEVSCDFEVCKNLSESQKKDYMIMLLDFVQMAVTQKRPLTTQMASSKKTLERRLIMIKTKKATGKLISALSVVIAIAMFSATVFASGVLSGIAEDSYTIEITNNGEKIVLAHLPFIENNTVYLPLRELLVMEQVKNEDITYYNGYVEFSVPAVPSVEYRGEQYDSWINRILIDSPYAYIGGHSHGTTENAELLRSPILKDGTTYAPFDLFDKLKNQGIFDQFAVSVRSKTGEALSLSGALYRNDDVNFTIEIPFCWDGKYVIETVSDHGDDIVFFKHKATDAKYEGIGTLFYIERNKTGIDENIGNQKLLSEEGAYKFILGRPTDVQHPIWTDRDAEDIRIAAEYEEMAKDIVSIEESFDTIVKFTPLTNTDRQPFTSEEIASARAVVEEYYRAKNARDTEAALNTLTAWYSAPNVVLWQDETIEVTDIRYDPNDELREQYVTNGRGTVNHTAIENVLVLRVDYTVKDAEKSVFNNGDYKNWGMILIRENQNSNWLIDDMGI